MRLCKMVAPLGAATLLLSGLLGEALAQTIQHEVNGQPRTFDFKQGAPAPSASGQSIATPLPRRQRPSAAGLPRGPKNIPWDEPGKISGVPGVQENAATNLPGVRGKASRAQRARTEARVEEGAGSAPQAVESRRPDGGADARIRQGQSDALTPPEAAETFKPAAAPSSSSGQPGQRADTCRSRPTARRGGSQSQDHRGCQGEGSRRRATQARSREKQGSPRPPARPAIGRRGDGPTGSAGSAGSAFDRHDPRIASVGPRRAPARRPPGRSSVEHDGAHEHRDAASDFFVEGRSLQEGLFRHHAGLLRRCPDRPEPAARSPCRAGRQRARSRCVLIEPIKRMNVIDSNRLSMMFCRKVVSPFRHHALGEDGLVVTRDLPAPQEQPRRNDARRPP